MNVNDAFPSKYLKAADLKGKKIRVQIERVTQETMGKDIRPVLYFFGKEKGMVLNKTNAMTIAAVHGVEMDQWPGIEINLYATKVPMEGQMVDALRVEVFQQIASAEQEPDF